MARRFVVGPLLLASVLIGGVACAGEPPTVIRVIDGDTLDVRVDGQTERIRLLNVDTPETKHPDKAVECLGPEAPEFLQELLPEGQVVELAFDTEKQDSYGRTLAGVFKDDVLVNAEIAREGLGVASYVAPNRRFLSEVEAAQAEAEEAGRGLFDEEIDCTVPGMIAATSTAISELPAEYPDDVEELKSLIGEAAFAAGLAAALLASFDALESAVDSPSWVIHEHKLKSARDEVGAQLETLQNWDDDVRERVAEIEEEQRLEDERRAAEEQAEAERQWLAQQEHERQVEAERQRAAQAERDRQAELQRQPQSPSHQAPAPQNPAPAPSNPSTGTSNRDNNGAPPGYVHKDDETGYTGPRCFAPGGVYWRPCP